MPIVVPLALLAASLAAPPTADAYSLRNTAASDAAGAVRAFAAAHHWPVVAGCDPVTNTVFVRAAPARRAEVARLLAALDAPIPMVLVQTIFARVPAGFAESAGLADAPAPAGGEARTWVLTAREARMLTAALRLAPGCEVLSRPTLTLTDNQQGFFSHVPPTAGVAGDQAAPVNVVEPPDAVSMRVTPRIDDAARAVHLRLEIAVAGSAAGASETVPSGGTLVVLRGGVLVVATVYKIEP